ncbi:Cytochrome b561 and DOMON domain-containing protein [Dioscorea alata]|uniref:Cytochrome b561 and DOMON domain-containing protein n=1 Tax=Dioscorea alata TaxID=55571 RepID=A0ACB7UU04_DIOAL|nr:Cytochrome b561 and DOMON domain-containing protein [Dioscorea alata]
MASPSPSPGMLLAVFACVVIFSSSLSHAQSCSSVAFSKNQLYSACSSLPHLSSSIHWTFDRANSTLSVAFLAPPAASGGWIAWAINPTGLHMAGSQSLIAFRDSKGSLTAKTFNITGYAPLNPSPIDFEVWDLQAEDSGGVMRIFAKIKLRKEMTTINQVWQVGSSVTDGVPDKHAFAPENLAAMGTLDLIKGVSSTGSDSTVKKRNIHGVLNAVSWGVLLPIGVIMARYLKTFASLDPAWFYLHVGFQLSGYIIGVAGWATGLNLGSKSKGVTYSSHRSIGIAIFSLATLQIFALFLRPNKDHKYRFYWNIYHHSVGYGVIILGIINIFKGFDILNPHQSWKNAYIIVISALACIALLLEISTWIVVLRRKSNKSSKLYNGSSGQQGVQQPLHV